MFRSFLKIVVFLTAVSTWAAPALRGSFTMRQPDGSFLTIEQFGDEHHHWTSTSDGTLVINKGGAYYVAAIFHTKARHVFSPFWPPSRTAPSPLMSPSRLLISILTGRFRQT